MTDAGIRLPRRFTTCCDRHGARLRPLHLRAGDRVLVDMDGTLSDVGWASRWVDADHPHWREHPDRRPLSSNGRFRRNFHRFHREGCAAPFRPEVLRYVAAIIAAGGLVEIVTAREERWRDATETSLVEHGVDHLGITMRPSGDQRPDVEVKRDILRSLRADPRPIVAAVDDRPSVARLWHNHEIAAALVPPRDAMGGAPGPRDDGPGR